MLSLEAQLSLEFPLC